MKTWTAEEIFKNPSKGFDTDWIEWIEGRLKPEFIEFLKSVPDFEAVDKELLHFPVEDRQPVGQGEKVCPLCENTRRYGIKLVSPGTGLQVVRFYPCYCKMWVRFWSIWKHVPERFRDVTLKTIEPRKTMSISLERQQEILDKLKAKPGDSYFLYGPVGTGKSHFATALFRHALEESLFNQLDAGISCTAVWHISALRMLKENTDWISRNRSDANDETPAPALTEAKIKKLAPYAQFKVKPCRFLDELDKVAMTDAKSAILTNIVNAVYEAKGQLVTTSNFGYDQLCNKWGREVAGTVVRRFGPDEGAHSILFSNSIPAASPNSKLERTEDLATYARAVENAEDDSEILGALTGSTEPTPAPQVTRTHRPAPAPAPAPASAISAQDTPNFDATLKRGAIVPPMGR